MKAISALLAGVSLLGLASAAAAQTTDAAGTGGAAALNEVVVTGSRVLKNGNASPTPVTIVSAEQLVNLQPGPIAEVLSNLPVFSGSRTATGNPGTGVSNSGANELNLRSLGFARTLVLFDGHRVGPTTYDQIVDVDSIPQLLLQRVDVVTGGVSAVYGSDAVAGVVNFVTDTKFNGLKLDVEGGVSTHGDDQQVTAGIAVGRKFAGDKGHIELSYQYHNDPGIPYRSDRDWGKQVYTVEGLGTTAVPFRLISQARFTTTTFGGLINSETGAGGAALVGQLFSSNGVLSPYVHGTYNGQTGYESGGGSGAYYDGSLKSSLNSHQFFGRVDYDFTDAIHGYVEGTGTLNRNESFGQYNQFVNLNFSGQNAFLPAQYQYTGTFKMSEMMSIMPRIDTNTNETQYFIVGGLNGDIFGGYKWDVSYAHSNNQSTSRNDEQVNQQKLWAALDAVKDSTGNIVCHVTVTNPGLYPGCVPLNAFGPTAPSAAALAYITQPSQFTVVNGMDDVAGSISGSPFSTWAGPITTALSGEWRNQTFSVSSTAQPSQTATCTGLVITGTTSNCTATSSLWLDATLGNLSQVNNSVAEAAMEAEIPLLKDMPLAQNLSFNGAVRYANYKTSGSATTWKVGLVWQVNDQLKLRATRSRDFRAPTLYDLYQPASLTLSTHADLLTGLSTAVPTSTTGNAHLTPEVGSTTEAGLVYQPSWLPRFSFSVDAYYIDVTNAIYQVAGYGPQQTNCYTGAALASLPPYCALMTRPGSSTNTAASNQVTSWIVETLNVAEVKTYGADFEANYATTAFSRPLSLRALVTYQPHNTLISIPGIAPVELAGVGFPNFGSGGSPAIAVVRAMLFADYRIGNLDIGVLERWRSSLSFANNPAQVFAGQKSIGPTQYTNLNLAYKLDKGWTSGGEIFFNVQNLFDTPPQPIANSGQTSSAGNFGGFATGDDAIGRYFTFGFRYRH